MELDPQELKIDVFRERSKGGWSTQPDVGVRITHVPSGIFAEHSQDRSIHRNKAVALHLLQQKMDESGWTPPTQEEKDQALRNEIEDAFKKKFAYMKDQLVGETLDIVWLAFVHGYLARKEAEK